MEVKPLLSRDCTVDSDVNTKDCGTHYENQTINGRWSGSEAKPYINILELLAIKFASYYLLPVEGEKKLLRIETDNSAEISSINRQRGVRSMAFTNVAKDIWDFFMK